MAAKGELAAQGRLSLGREYDSFLVSDTNKSLRTLMFENSS